MKTKYTLHIAPTDSNANAGATRAADGRRPTIVLLIALVLLAVAAPLLVTLPQTLDARRAGRPRGVVIDHVRRHELIDDSELALAEGLFEDST